MSDRPTKQKPSTQSSKLPVVSSTSASSSTSTSGVGGTGISSSSSSTSSRLHAIAPREDQALQSPESAPASSLTIVDVPRTRLPPRSRNGCWTCRTRKVKCDEAKPRCNQCTRLGHGCDYSPKLAFKDETAKVVDKYLGPGVPAGKWNPTADFSPTESSLAGNEEDTLPPFTSLTNDEDWQRKAEHRPPGTYFVIANPESFIDDDSKNSRNEVAVESSSGSQVTTVRSPTGPGNTPIDDVTVVLGSFEDDSRRQSLFASTTERRKSASSAGSPTSPLARRFSANLRNLNIAAEIKPEPPPMDTPTDVSKQALMFHYRTVVRRHLLQAQQDAALDLTGIEDSFEREAVTFPPLRHALLALSALSLSLKDGSQSIHALQHYQKAIDPLHSLQSELDLASNGAFLTHFILLIYEIAGTESFWSSHMATLRNIIEQRNEVLDAEPYPYVIWWICLIDINALMSGSGKGEFVNQMMQKGMVPTAVEIRRSPSFLGPIPLLPGDRDVTIEALNLHRETALQAAKTGHLGKRIRQALQKQSGVIQQAKIDEWRGQAAAVRNSLKQKWRETLTSTLAEGLDTGALIGSTRNIVEQSILTHNACIIYACTSLWPTQRLNSEPESEEDLKRAASTIVRVTSEIVNRGQLENRFAVFPLFMAGVAASSAPEKMLVQDLMQSFERESVGSNTRATRKLLEGFFERQNRSVMANGHSFDIDWVSIMAEVGPHVVNCGL